MAEQQDKQGLVLYSDGGARPTNPGPAGYGIHGYLYSIEEPKKGLGLGNIIATSTGYRDKSRPISSAELDKGFSDKPVSVLKYIDSYSSFPAPLTNNQAELIAATRALKLATELICGEVILLADSRYVVDGFNDHHYKWMRNGWKTMNGDDVRNRTEWESLIDAKNELAVRGIGFRIEWTKAHVDTLDSIGNTKADKLATVGAIRSMDGVHTKSTFNEQTISDPDGYWRARVARHPMVCLRRMYFRTQKETIQEGVYFIGNHGSDDESLGTRTADGAYGVVVLQQPDPTLERIRDSLTYPDSEHETVAALHLDTLYNPDFYGDWLQHGIFAIDRYVPNTANTRTLAKLPLSNEFNPAMLSWRAMTALGELYHDLAALNGGKFESIPGFKVNEITDHLYTKVEKKSKKGEVSYENILKPEYNVGFASFKREIEYDQTTTTKGNGKLSVSVTLGIDLPERNTLKNLESLNPRVFIVAKSVSQESVRYFTIVHTADAVGIYAGIYSNIRFII